MRGIVTAISWFNPGIRAFSGNGLRDALSYCAVSADLRSEAVEVLTTMHGEIVKTLGPVTTLARVTSKR